MQDHPTLTPPRAPTLAPEPVASDNGRRGLGFSTAPVFLASISTILGAIMFLRFGYAVGHVGLLGALLIILLGHLVTVPTALAIAEIATNRRVEGGGEYFIISRSFGTTIGGAIGISLYLSQAISVAFYMIAFAEAFRPLAPWLEATTGLAFDPRLVSLPASLVLMLLVLTRGANLGVKALWVVVSVLAVSLLLFFMGSPAEGAQPEGLSIFGGIEDSDPFILVFAICFPAFTGMTAGVGLSGDLANPRKSIPVGILSATLVGMAVYVALVVKLALSATPEMLASDQLVMSKIAVWGPIIPIGLACATLSSAIGSLLVAPRTLQALAADGTLPVPQVNQFLQHGTGTANEPRNATVITAVLAVATVSMGNVDFVARIISMFFMVTYGALCAISFLEHFAARPSYRPSFRSKWYLSLIGAVICLLLMFQMDPVYAVIAILLMIGIYRMIQASRGDRSNDLSAIYHGVTTQAIRYLHVRLQQSLSGARGGDWRPSIIMVNGRTFERWAPFQFFTWLCHRYGFGTYLHYIPGHLDAETFKESRKAQARLIRMTQHRRSGFYVDTMVSPSLRSALAQSLQVPGVSGMDNNTILFEFSIHDDDTIPREIQDGCIFAGAARMNRLVLRHGEQYFGSRKSIHVWLTGEDYRNANLMILLAYILLGHPDWNEAEISIFATFAREQAEEQTQQLKEMITTGRLPIAERNIRILPSDERTDFRALVEARSAGADLVMLGFTEAHLAAEGIELFRRHPAIGDLLFVSAQQRIAIE